MYKDTDVILKLLYKEFVRIFNKARSIVKFDEVNILSYSQSMYTELDMLVRKYLLALANKVYRKHREAPTRYDGLEMPWVMGWLDDYNPVTKYVYTHEVERKRARFAEGVIASPTPLKEVEVSLRYWSNMATQYANDITDQAMLEAYRDDGVKFVQWVTVEDERRCIKCAARHLKVYPIDKIPPKPHIGCRCYLVPYKKKKR